MHLECCAKMQATIGYSKYWNMSQEAIKSHLKGELIRLWNTRVATPPTVSDDVAALRAALADLVRKRESILIDVRSAHSARGDGAASWMREDDRDFIRDLDLAFDAAEAALAKIKGVS